MINNCDVTEFENNSTLTQVVYADIKYNRGQAQPKTKERADVGVTTVSIKYKSTEMYPENV